MEKLLTAKDVIEITRLSRSKVNALIASREIPSVGIGRARRVLPEDLHSWLLAHRQERPAEPTRRRNQSRMEECPTCGHFTINDTALYEALDRAT